jgi:hypothetical protein
MSSVEGALSLVGVMKPKPFLLENHLTVPLIFSGILLAVCVEDND